MIIKRKNICYLRVSALKGNDNYQDFIQIVKLYNWSNSDVLIKAKPSSHSMGINAKRDSRHNSMPNKTDCLRNMKMYA